MCAAIPLSPSSRKLLATWAGGAIETDTVPGGLGGREGDQVRIIVLLFLSFSKHGN